MIFLVGERRRIRVDVEPVEHGAKDGLDPGAPQRVVLTKMNLDQTSALDLLLHGPEFEVEYFLEGLPEVHMAQPEHDPKMKDQHGGRLEAGLVAEATVLEAVSTFAEQAVEVVLGHRYDQLRSLVV